MCLWASIFHWSWTEEYYNCLVLSGYKLDGNRNNVGEVEYIGVPGVVIIITEHICVEMAFI